MSFFVAQWSIQPLNLLVVLAVAGLYVRGWRKLRAWVPGFATGRRLAIFVAGLTVFVAATMSPLHWWSNYLLTARALQKVMLCMLAPPMLWLAAPLVILRAGAPFSWRRAVRRAGIEARLSHTLTSPLSRPILTVMLFVSVFLLWHDPAVAGLTLSTESLHLASLWVLFAVALLYWRHIVGAGAPPGAGHAITISGWAAAAYLLAAEVPNMVAGIAIAFISTPIYTHYAEMRATMGALPVSVQEDQMIAGAVVWVIGSLVYVSSIVLVVNRIFTREGVDQPVARQTWDIDEKFIAPGLEHRLVQPDYARANWGQD